ncbi:integrase arm-type DNA-binding domain-containing protein [Photobacterium damselae subsp. damselae]|uniref:tyrosine-type recombinase/integrase n=1 Tax=Photobacterium damselae TaxID=38293 RepID=UPI00311B0BBC
MPRIVKPLTDKEVKTAKPKNKDFTLRDGDGLYLIVRKSGTKSWYVDYYSPTSKKRVNLHLGGYPVVSLAQARDKRREVKNLVLDGVEPKYHEMKKRAQATREELNTFKAVSVLWLEQRKKKLDGDYYKQICSFLNNHLYPSFGDIPINLITPPMAIKELKKTASVTSDDFVLRLIRVLNQVVDYAVNTGLAEFNPLLGIKAAFTAEEPKPMATIEHEELSALLKEIGELKLNPTTRNLLLWQLHTMVRPEEATSAEWEEIDFDNKLWTIPPGKTKKRREHIVPLTDQALRILSEMKEINWNRKHVFSSPQNNGRPMFRGTVNRILGKTSFKGRIVAHGFRALASTTINEQANFRPDLVDECLSHQVRSRTESRYNRSKNLDHRRPIMCWWSDFISSLIS